MNKKMPHATMSFLLYMKIHESTCLPQWREERNWKGGTRRGIIVYLEYQSVCPFVEIGSHYPLPLAGGCLPPWNQKREDQHSTVPRGWGDPVRTTVNKSWHSVNFVEVLHPTCLWMGRGGVNLWSSFRKDDIRTWAYLLFFILRFWLQ